ncbi:MAG: formylglycine-generating enzyme family protein [Cyanobacteria bacterium P01_F01_bin.143]
MGDNPSHFTDDDQRPVEQVSWLNSVEFCRKLSKQTGKEYRLPTETEWEYACRAGTTTAYYFGESITKKQANYDNNIGKTTAVGKYPSNAFGLNDMHGNVWEWCQDELHNYNSYKSFMKNTSILSTLNHPAMFFGPNIGILGGIKIIRGGSWRELGDFCRSSITGYFPAVKRSNCIGFRVVCNVPIT